MNVGGQFETGAAEDLGPGEAETAAQTDAAVGSERLAVGYLAAMSSALAEALVAALAAAAAAAAGTCSSLAAVAVLGLALDCSAHAAERFGAEGLACSGE